MLNQELIQQEYGFLKDEIFLNVSQVCMPPVRVQKAYGSFMDDYVKVFGDGVVDTAWNIVADCREKVAKLINAKEVHEIAFVKNTAEGMSILAAGYPLQSGDSIVIADQEHQSTLFPWINAHEQRGITLKVVKSVNGEIPMSDMIAAIDDTTKVLVVSSAQFSTGFRADLALLGEESALFAFYLETGSPGVTSFSLSNLVLIQSPSVPQQMKPVAGKGHPSHFSDRVQTGASVISGGLE